jgi:cytoskeletal protein CcmA (bactofilin family)
VNGAIHAKDRVELQATAVVSGDILTARIAIVEGASVSGEVKMDPSRASGAGQVAR